MTKQELMDELLAERAKLNAVIAPLTPTQMTTTGVCGHWTVKDVLAHLAMWTAREVTVLFQAERTGRPSYGVPNDSAADWANVNGKDYALQKDRTLDQVLGDFHGSHEQLIKRLNGMDENVLFRKKFVGISGVLADNMLDGVSRHDAEHREQIEAWLKR